MKRSPLAPRAADAIGALRPSESTTNTRIGNSSIAHATNGANDVPIRPRQTHPLLLALSLLLIACNLRPVFGSLSVVLPDMMRDTGLSATGASLLTTLPIVCLGIFSAPAPALARRFGVERTLLGAMFLICVGTLLRAWVSLPLLFA